MGVSGHCLCRAVTYQVEGTPKWIAHCHCESCRRHTASAVATFLGADETNVRWTGIEPARYESSPQTWRSFCPRCGTPIAYQSVRHPGEIHFYLGTVEDASQYPAAAHVFVDEQLPWFEIADECPRFAQSGGRGTMPVRIGPARRK